jgi:hypothetical protein
MPGWGRDERVDTIFFEDLTGNPSPGIDGQVSYVSGKIYSQAGFFYGASATERIIEVDPTNQTIGIMEGAPNTSYFVYLRRVESGASGGLSTPRRGFHSLMQINSGSDSRGMFATSGIMSLSSAAVQTGVDSQILAGVYGQVNQASTGTASELVGTGGDCYVSGSFGSTMGNITLGVGVRGQVGFGYGFLVPPNGSYTNAAAFEACAPRQPTTTRTITNCHGVWVRNQGGRGIETSYGIKLEAQTGAKESWSISSLGGNSYHSGNFYFGGKGPPSDPIHVKCGSGTGIRVESQTVSSNYAVLNRTGGNFAISVYGTDACALYHNAKIGMWQLGGISTSQYWQVQNGIDSACFTIYGDRTWKFYGNGTMFGDYDLAPSVDNQGELGTDSLRFKRIRAVNIVSGDLGFDDERCPLCGLEFGIDDVVVWRITSQTRDEKDRLVSSSIPVHSKCANPPWYKRLFRVILRKMICLTR